MTDHPYRHFGNLRTTSQVINLTTASFTSNIYPFLFLSLLLFSFRTLVENGSHHLTSFIDRDPSLQSLLSRLDLAAHHPHPHAPNHPRRRPFLHLTRVGTLDDDFFSGDDDPDRPSSGPRGRNLSHNATSLILSNFDPGFGFSPFVSDNGLLLPELIRSGVRFKFGNPNPNPNQNEQVTGSGNYEGPQERDDNGSVRLGKTRDADRILDLQFLIRGLELGRRDAAALFFLVSSLSAAYGWIILGFTTMYSLILGIVFVAVVNDLLGKFSSFLGIAWDGSRLGLKRLTGFILMRWAVRDALTQLLGLWYFGEVEDQYSFFKLFVRLKLMPFSIMSPWIPGFEKEISGFLFTWFLSDTFVALIFAVDAWVTIVDSRRTGREIVKEGCYLIATMVNQAVQIKCFEAILCGTAARLVLTWVFGKFCATVFQSVAEVYFMVAWLVFYFAARCKIARSEGRSFGRRELEGLANGLR